MCLLTVFPAGVSPDMEKLTEGARCNPDGFGFAIADVNRNRLIVSRGMDAAEMLNRFDKTRQHYLEGPAMFHSRISTLGGIGKFNCHPFRAGQDWQTVIAHNGIIYSSVPVGGYSDTRYWAEYVFPEKYRRIDKPGVRTQAEKMLGWGNKVAIVTVNPRYKENLYILNEDLGKWDGGIWYSNQSYQPPKSYGYSRSTWNTGYDCQFCGSHESVHFGMCYRCHVCDWCGEEEKYCECTVSPRKSRVVTSRMSGIEMCNKCHYTKQFCRCAEPCGLLNPDHSRHFAGWCRTHHHSFEPNKPYCKIGAPANHGKELALVDEFLAWDGPAE